MNQFASIWRELKDEIRFALDNIVKQRRVVVVEPGAVTIENNDPDNPDQRSILRLRGIPIEPGDDVLVFNLLGAEIAFGAMSTEDDVEAVIPHEHAGGITNTTRIGEGATAKGAFGTALGNAARADKTSATAVGQSADATGVTSTALGQNANASGDQATALGQFSGATGTDATAAGQFAFATADRATAIGATTSANHAGATAIGRGASTTANNRATLAAMELEIVPDSANDPTGATKLRLRSPNGTMHVLEVNNTPQLLLDGNPV